MSNAACPICGDPSQSMTHLLPECNHAKATWMGSPLNYRPNTGNVTFVEWWSQMSAMVPGNQRHSFFQFVSFHCWHLWKARNQLVFDGVDPNPATTLSIAMANMAELHYLSNPQALANSPPQVREEAIAQGVLGHQVLEGMIMVSCDASWVFNQTEAGLGIVLRDCYGRLVDGINVL